MRQTKNTPAPDTPPGLPCEQPFHDREAIFHEHGPLHPRFMDESVRTLMRAMPLDPAEPPRWAHRRMWAALLALAALNPRDEIEVMMGVQAIAAYHAASACWRIGMNQRRPNGESTRHVTTAATAARTFDAMLRGLERRQAKPLSIPVGRPAPRVWPDTDPTAQTLYWEARTRRGEDEAIPEPLEKPDRGAEWTPQALQVYKQVHRQDQEAEATEGLDLSKIDGILPGGGMIMPENPTPQQSAYMARRVGMEMKRRFAENLRQGIPRPPKMWPIRPGDLVP
jgi:hypothetical protein